MRYTVLWKGDDGFPADYITKRQQRVKQSIIEVGHEVDTEAKYKVLRLPICKCIYMAVLPGSFHAFRPVQPESSANI